MLFLSSRRRSRENAERARKEWNEWYHKLGPEARAAVDRRRAKEADADGQFFLLVFVMFVLGLIALVAHSLGYF